ncbi:MAG: polysulfide reductase NrfD [Candidatus Schekmanbacteria bacterium]|nr:polysulfide reductase NrfD [Candidatus Schekmanbacteria bacterium]
MPILVPEHTGFLFPNDLHVSWSLMIVMYPYITGLVAGAFIVSSLYHVFGSERFAPVGRLSLGASFCFLIFATAPLLNHLGHPERAFNIMITPNFRSAMAGFGILYNTYMLILALEIWFVWRQDIILIARHSRGIKRQFYKLLALGVYDISAEALAHDRKATRILASIGIPAACALHGYVGFLFGALKSNPWWSTPLMPIVFLFSAVVSGIAALIIMYMISMKITGRSISDECVDGLSKMLWAFLIVTLTLEILEIVTLAYEAAEEWQIISSLLFSKLSLEYVGLQMMMGGFVPLILLAIIVLMSPTPPIRNTLALISSLLLLVQVFAMRWNVVIGGQLFSKSLRGFRDGYQPSFFEREGVLAAVLILLAPFAATLVFARVLPLFDYIDKQAQTRRPGPGEQQVPLTSE